MKAEAIVWYIGFPSVFFPLNVYMPICSELASFLKENKKESIFLEVWVLVCFSIFHNFVHTETKVIECFACMEVKANHLYFEEGNSC